MAKVESRADTVRTPGEESGSGSWTLPTAAGGRWTEDTRVHTHARAHTCTHARAHTAMHVFTHSPLPFQPLPAPSQPLQPSALSGSPSVLPMATQPPPGHGSGPAPSCSPAPTVIPPFLGHLRYLSDLQLLTCLPFLLDFKIQEVWESTGRGFLPGRQEVLGWFQWPVLPRLSDTNFGSLEPFLFSLHMSSPEPSIRNTKYEWGGFVLAAGPATRIAT